MKNPEITTPETRPLRLAILQRVCPNYRTALFSALSSNSELETTLFIGEDIPNSKVRNGSAFQGINLIKLRTRFVKVGQRVMPWHHGLIRHLRNYKPDVILCEGESHFLGYLQAIFYRIFFNRRAALIHWCFISLPGEPLQKPGIEKQIKAITRKFFDAFLLYSSYSKNCLTQLGVPADKAFVATNVGDVRKFIAISDTLPDSPEQARKILNLPPRFTVLYTGTLDANKKPEMMLDLARACDPSKFNFVILGSGEMLEELRSIATKHKVDNVFLPGRVVEQLPLYFRASNVLLIPGRGGIVISEAMAFGLPVVTHQADGTEYDLVRNDETGYILEKGDLADFKKAIEFLEGNKDKAGRMGRSSRQLVEELFTTDNMVNQIIKAARFANKRRVN